MSKSPVKPSRARTEYTDIGRLEPGYNWRELPNGTIFEDENGQRWRRLDSPQGGKVKLKVGGSHPGSGAKPASLRHRARDDLNDVLHRAREIALAKKAKPRDILNALKVLHQIGGLQSIALLNADGEEVHLQPLQVNLNVTPKPVASTAEEKE